MWSKRAKIMVTEDRLMEETDNHLANNESVKLMSYQKSPNSKEAEAMAPLAMEDDDVPPTPPPPPLPPLHLPMSSPTRPAENHPLTTGGSSDDHCPEDVSESATLHKSHDESLLVKESSRPKPVKGTIHMLSSLYAKILVTATTVLVTTEILPNSIPLFFYHGYIFTFLLGGAILCILCIYLSMCLQKCPGVEELEELDSESSDSKKIMRKVKYRAPEISIFFRVGALALVEILHEKWKNLLEKTLQHVPESIAVRGVAVVVTEVFGLGTLIAIGLEAATLFAGRNSPCVDELNFVQPILHALFTFMQMHFLSLNSQRAIQNLGWCRHIILMHLVATNLAVWLRLVLLETAKNWLDETHVVANATLKWPPKSYNTTVHAMFTNGRHGSFVSPSCFWSEIKEDEIEDLLALRQCYKNTTIGVIWDKAHPFILPFIIQYCLVGAVVNYVLWECFSNRSRRITRRTTSWSPRRQDIESATSKDEENRKVDCKGSSKGLFLGLLVLAVGIVVLILFFVLTNNKNLRVETLFIMIIVHCGILGISAFGIICGICRVGNMCTDYSRPHYLHTVLQNIGVIAVYIHGTCSIVVGATNIMNPRFMAICVDGGLMIFQSFIQSVFFHRISQKSCSKKCQHESSRPGRQIVTFLAFTNLVLWMTESFTDHDHLSSQLQLQFFGVVPWGLVTRLLFPLVIFYRFHSSIYLMEVWKSGYNVE